MLYSVYSWPNTVIVFFGGVLIDRYLGVRWGALLFSGLVCAGQVLFWFGGASNKFWLAILGRVVFGLGGESLGVAQSAYTAKFFKGNELAFAFGIALSFSRIGSAVNLNIEPMIVKSHGVPFGLFVGAMLCAASLVAAIVLGVQDKIAENRRKKADTGPAAAADPPPKLTDIRFFSLSIWLVYGICVTFYIGVFVLIQFGSQFVQHRYDLNEEAAGRIVSLPYIVSAGASPVLGFFVDMTGRAVWWITIATVLLTCAQFAFFLLPAEVGVAYGIFVTIGIAYSVCAAALWPCVAFEVPQKQLGSAYGLMNSIQNTGIAIAPLIIAAILEATEQNYKIMVFCFGVSSSIAAALSCLLLYVDFQRGEILNASAAKLKRMAAEAADAAKLAAAASSIQDLE